MMALIHWLVPSSGSARQQHAEEPEQKSGFTPPCTFPVVSLTARALWQGNLIVNSISP